MQQKLKAEEYASLKTLEKHITTARVGYVRGMTSEEQKTLKQVHNAYFTTYKNAGPVLCSQCVMQMLRDLLPLFDSYAPEKPKAVKVSRKKK